jgi:hypothetical protein
VSGGLEAARRHLAVAVAELEAAVGAWGLWADEIREQAERRMGAAPCDPEVRDDPQYARALDAGGPFIEAARAAAAALKATGQMPGGLAALTGHARKRQ